MINPKSKYYQYYQTNPKSQIQKFGIWKLEFIWDLVVFGFGSIFVLAVLGAGICGCSEKPDEASEIVKAASIDTEDIEQKVLQFDLTAYTDKGAKRWEIKGKSADMVDETVKLKDIVASTYGKDNTLTSPSLRASSGY